MTQKNKPQSVSDGVYWSLDSSVATLWESYNILELSHHTYSQC